MALVQAELTDGTDAITIRRRDPGPWRRYLAVINCRGGSLLPAILLQVA